MVHSCLILFTNVTLSNWKFKINTSTLTGMHCPEPPTVSKQPRVATEYVTTLAGNKPFNITCVSWCQKIITTATYFSHPQAQYSITTLSWPIQKGNVKKLINQYLDLKTFLKNG